jgi:hypothetical protein
MAEVDRIQPVNGAAPPPKAGEVQIDAGRLGSDDIGEVGDALAGLFPDHTPIQQRETPAEDAEQEETPAIGEHEDGQSEQPEGAAIEPPVSWTAEEKQLFAQLPPELQQTVLRRESERDRLTSTQSQKASEEARRLEAERTLLANDRAQQVTLLQSVLYQLTPELQRFQQIDWDKLARERPAEWAQERQAFDGLQMRWNIAQQQIGQIQTQQQNDQAKQQQTFLQAEHTKLVEKVPEFADRAKLKAFGEDLVKYLPEFTAQEINSVADHRQLMIARDAMLYRKAMALRAQAQTKRTPPAQTQRQQPLRTNARRGDAGEEANGRVLGALHETLRNKGTTQAAADLLTATGIFGKA